MEAAIRTNAELFRRVAMEHMSVDLNYDLEGVRWLDGFIDRQRDGASDNSKAKLPNTAGSYLGECIRRTFGGKWVQHPEYGWSVQITDSLSAYPFNKVHKQLVNPEGDSVLGLFTAIGPLMSAQKRETKKKAVIAQERPWWKFW